MAPLYAHLARDPVPTTLMKNKAPNVYRWTERMNLAAIADGEFPNCPETYLPGDAIPPTLEPVLRLIFQDWAPDILANAACYNAWISANADLAAGALVALDGARSVHPTLGPIEYTLRDCAMRRASSPHALWHFDRAASYAMGLIGKPAKAQAALLKTHRREWCWGGAGATDAAPGLCAGGVLSASGSTVTNTTGALMDFPTRQIQINGIRMNVVIVGEGPDVLLVHGYPDTHAIWRHQIPVLVAAGYRVIAPDTRGCGETEISPGALIIIFTIW